MKFVKKIKTFCYYLGNLHYKIEKKVADFLISINDKFIILSLLLYLLFNIWWILFTYIFDIIVLICVIFFYIIKRKWFLLTQLFVNEILDKIIFFFLFFKLKEIYIILYTIYMALKYFFNTEKSISNYTSIVEWIIYIDLFFVDIIDKKKNVINNKLKIFNI